MDAGFLRAKHEAGLSYEEYVGRGTQGQQADWRGVYERVVLKREQEELIRGFKRKMRVLVLSGIWCGDCVQQGPVLARLAEVNEGCVDMKWLERDGHRDLMERVRINAGDRVPVVLFCAEDYELVGWYGDKTLSRYRRMASQQLGPNCVVGGRDVKEGELGEMAQDWLDELERVQLLLRLSARLRRAHND